VTFLDFAEIHSLAEESPMSITNHPFSMTSLQTSSTGPASRSQNVALLLGEPHHRGRRPAMRRMHTMATQISAAEFDSMIAEHAEGKRVLPQRRAKSMGAAVGRRVAVSVVAPGGGTGCNAASYAALARNEGVSVAIQGQSRAEYDCYPLGWEEGAPAPNLETFALDLLDQGIIQRSDCLVVGSRGGQVVLPTLWRESGNTIPPAVVMNGGCAMSLPAPVLWPDEAVTLLLIGGQDYFKGHISSDQYIVNTQRYVPSANVTTAILFVREMAHMPQAELLDAILLHMILSVTAWKSSGHVPDDELLTMLRALSTGGWSGSLVYKSVPGTRDAWQVVDFP